jgi:hypothetical protein
MKGLTFLCTVAAAATLSCNAFAQASAPNSSNLNAGDNVQSTPVHKSTHTKKMKSTKAGAAGPSTQPGGTATPSGPGAPVSASGSGQ